jgi:CHAT domain-containing protein/tetratricopeptide (TPR) repeat protein
LNTGNVYGQANSLTGTDLIDHYLVNDQIEQADSVLHLQLKELKADGKIDSLYRYPYYVGKIELDKTNANNAVVSTELFVLDIRNKTPDKRTHYKSLLNLALFYDEVGETQKSYEVSKEALEIVLSMDDASLYEIGNARYNLAFGIYSLGNMEEATVHFKRALTDFESASTPTEKLADAYNAVGAMMWMSSKLDSAQYYYEKAVSSVEQAKEDTILNLYLSAVFKGNIALLQESQGQISESLKTQKEIISISQKVINLSQDESLKSKAQQFQIRAIANLAGFYNDHGNVFRGNELIKYAYKKRGEILEPTDPELAKNLVLIGQSENSLQEFDRAIVTLNKAIQKFRNATGSNTLWEGTAYHALAIAYESKNNTEKAKEYYDKSEQLLEKAHGENYDRGFLTFLSDKALFQANNQQTESAIETAMKAYDYVLSKSDEPDAQIIKQIINLAEVYYLIGDFDQSLAWSKKGILYIDNNLNMSSGALDSMMFEFEKPSLLLLETKSAYNLTSTKDPIFYSNELSKLNMAIAILNKRKTVTFNAVDLNLLFAAHKSVYDFASRLNIELYKLTKNGLYLEKAILLKESSTFNRIRTQLNIRGNIAFSNVQKTILERERLLKSRINTSLSNSTDYGDDIQLFFDALTDWDAFLDTLKNEFPKYYNMRYANINESLANLQKQLPENTTVVRYLILEKELYAFVMDREKKEIYQLKGKSIKDQISKANDFNTDLEHLYKKQFELYQSLWQPFETSISTEHVIIIPDGELYNLSFETLTPTNINSYQDFATNSLLAKYAISYNYSLFLIQDENNTIKYTESFVAFVPEFNDQMKQNYKILIEDSLALDKTYLTLLPQPFSLELAKSSTQLFNGTSFLNENSTKQIFKNSAKEHKIIHIGSHAESNNLSPELSRIIFAKNVFDKINEDENSLYIYEIYDCNLSSNLTILTACETGKPTYQPGEGMISLAHAFNYAGSESILTSLWKIDEKSSAEIVTLFYDQLLKGLTKDKALQLAKLAYLKSKDGRTLSPKYWAGLILIGNTSPISNLRSNSVLILILSILLFLGLFFLFNRNRKKV